MPYDPRNETPYEEEIFAPMPGEVVTPQDSALTSEEYEVPSVGRDIGPVMYGGIQMSGYAPSKVLTPEEAEARGPTYTPISSGLVSAMATDILAEQGYNPDGTPKLSTGSQDGIIGSRNEFINSYFKANGNPMEINVSAQTDKIMEQNMKQLWDSFFAGRVPFGGKVTGKQSKEWATFLQAVYADTYNRVQEDKNNQLNDFKFALGEFGIEEQREYNQYLEDQKAAAAKIKGQADDVREMLKFKIKEEYKREQAIKNPSTVADFQANIVRDFINGKDLDERQLKVADLEDHVNGMKTIQGIMAVDPSNAVQAYLSKAGMITDEEAEKNGWDETTKRMKSAERYLSTLTGMSKGVEKALREGKPVEDLTFMMESKMLVAKYEKMTEQLLKDSKRHIWFDKTLPAKTLAIRQETVLRNTLGYSREDAENYTKYIIGLANKEDQKRRAELPES